jgi:ribosomal protein L19
MNKGAILESVAKDCMKTDLPEFRPGDTVRAHAKVREGGKERIQIFEGVLIAIKNGGANISRTFPDDRKVRGHSSWRCSASQTLLPSR